MQKCACHDGQLWSRYRCQMTFMYSGPCLQCWHNIADAAVQSVLGRKFTHWDLASVMGWLHQGKSIPVQYAFVDPVLRSCQGLHMLSIYCKITVSHVSTLPSENVVQWLDCCPNGLAFWVAECCVAECFQSEAQLLLQLIWMDLSSNRLNGTLPSTWPGLTQASHAV